MSNNKKPFPLMNEIFEIKRSYEANYSPPPVGKIQETPKPLPLDRVRDMDEISGVNSYRGNYSPSPVDKVQETPKPQSDNNPKQKDDKS